MGKQPVVSVLMPTYNYAHTIGEAIESVLAQTFRNFELIIVDDCSSDETDKVVAQYLYDKRVVYYKNETNLGLVGNFNKCLQLANGEYIKYLLADDRFEPQILQKMVRVMEYFPEVSLVTSFSKTFGSRTRLRQQPFCFLKSGNLVIRESILGGKGNWIGEPSTVMFRRRDLVVGGFSAELFCLVDWDMWLRLLTIGDCYIIPEVLSHFRVHNQQASKRILQYSQYTFEDYFFYKRIVTQRLYNFPPNEVCLNNIIRRKATFCAKAMYRAAIRLYQKQSRNVFVKGYKIAANELVLLSPFLDFVKKRTARNLPTQASVNAK